MKVNLYARVDLGCSSYGTGFEIDTSDYRTAKDLFAEIEQYMIETTGHDDGSVSFNIEVEGD